MAHGATGAERGSDVDTEQDAWDLPEEPLSPVGGSRGVGQKPKAREAVLPGAAPPGES